MPRGKDLFGIPPDVRESAERQLKKFQKEVRFDVRDFPIETIVARFQKQLFFIPPYQREFIWTENDQSQFIESVIMGLPIPMMFLAEDEDSTFEIVDGVQRIKSLDAFLSDELKLEGLEKLNELNGFRFSDLPEAQRNKLTSRALRLVILDPETSDENRHDLFDRINKFGRQTKESERRRGSFAGKFMVFLESRAEDPLFRRLCPVSKSMARRREPLELVTRFFAYSDRYLDFEHDVDGFLDDFVKDHRDSFDEVKYKSEFDSTMEFVQKNFPFGFAKSANAKTTPRVRFESLSVGVNLALRQKPGLIPAPVTSWLASPEFLSQTTTHGSNSALRLQGRVEFVRDKLLEGA